MKLTSSSQLDWSVAHVAAMNIARTCEGAGYTAPEALDVHRAKVVLVCEQINQIVKALCITPPPHISVVP